MKPHALLLGVIALVIARTVTVDGFIKAAVGIRIGLSPTEKGYGKPYPVSSLYRGPGVKAQLMTGVHGKPPGHHGFGNKNGHAHPRAHNGGGIATGILKHLKILGVNLYLGGPRRGPPPPHGPPPPGHHGPPGPHGPPHHPNDVRDIDEQNQISGHPSNQVPQTYSPNSPTGFGSAPSETQQQTSQTQPANPNQIQQGESPTKGPPPQGKGFPLASMMRGPQWKPQPRFPFSLLSFGRGPPPPPPGHPAHPNSRPGGNPMRPAYSTLFSTSANNNPHFRPPIRPTVLTPSEAPTQPQNQKQTNPSKYPNYKNQGMQQLNPKLRQYFQVFPHPSYFKNVNKIPGNTFSSNNHVQNFHQPPQYHGQRQFQSAPFNNFPREQHGGQDAPYPRPYNALSHTQQQHFRQNGPPQFIPFPPNNEDGPMFGSQEASDQGPSYNPPFGPENQNPFASQRQREQYAQQQRHQTQSYAPNAAEHSPEPDRERDTGMPMPPHMPNEYQPPPGYQYSYTESSPGVSMGVTTYDDPPIVMSNQGYEDSPTNGPAQSQIQSPGSEGSYQRSYNTGGAMSNHHLQNSLRRWNPVTSESDMVNSQTEISVARAVAPASVREKSSNNKASSSEKRTVYMRRRKLTTEPSTASSEVSTVSNSILSAGSPSSSGEDLTTTTFSAKGVSPSPKSTTSAPKDSSRPSMVSLEEIIARRTAAKNSSKENKSQ